MNDDSMFFRFQNSLVEGLSKPLFCRREDQLLSQNQAPCKNSCLEQCEHQLLCKCRTRPLSSRCNIKQLLFIKCYRMVFSCPLIYSAGSFPSRSKAHRRTLARIGCAPKALGRHFSSVPFPAKKGNEIERCSQIPESSVTFLLETLFLIQSLVFT